MFSCSSHLQDMLLDMDTGGEHSMYFGTPAEVYIHGVCASVRFLLHTCALKLSCSHLRACTNVFLRVYAGSPVVAVVTHH